jgi:cell division protein FtsI (penicillin-binding protein 3)
MARRMTQAGPDRVEPIKELVRKIARSRDKLSDAHEHGSQLYAFWPAANRADVDEQTRTALAALDVRVREITTVEEALDSLGLSAPERGGVPAASTAAPAEAASRQKRTYHPIWGRIGARSGALALSVVVACTLGAGSLVAFKPWPVSAILRHARSAGYFLPPRAQILDRNGMVLAQNVFASSLFADPSRVRDAKGAATSVCAILKNCDRDELAARMSAHKRFVWIARRLSESQTNAIKKLAIPGLGLRLENARAYPQGRLTSNVVGFTDVDNVGQTGIEFGEDSCLRTSNTPLRLTLDVRIQSALSDSLLAVMQETRPSHAAGVVLDTETGAVLALISLPSVDPMPIHDAPSLMFNWATQADLGIGEFYNYFLAARALDLGAASDSIRKLPTVSPEEELTASVTARDLYRIGDVPLSRYVSVSQMTPFLSRVGPLQRESLEIPEITKPLAPRLQGPNAPAGIQYGTDIVVTALQMSAALGALVNGGVLVQPTLLQARADLKASERIISSGASEALRALMDQREAVSVWGASINGRIGRERTIVSTFGYAPLLEPRYVTFITLVAPRIPRSLSAIRASASLTLENILRTTSRFTGPLK